MEIDDTLDRELQCFLDNARVSGQSPHCLHPSGFCPFRDFCPVLEMERRLAGPVATRRRDWDT